MFHYVMQIDCVFYNRNLTRFWRVFKFDTVCGSFEFSGIDSFAPLYNISEGNGFPTVFTSEKFLLFHHTTECVMCLCICYISLRYWIWDICFNMLLPSVLLPVLHLILIKIEDLIHCIRSVFYKIYSFAAFLPKHLYIFLVSSNYSSTP